MRPVIERTPVTAQCPKGHKWETEILPGSTMPQSPECPECGLTVSFYPSLREQYQSSDNQLDSNTTSTAKSESEHAAKRRTNTSDRYHVGDPTCGMIETATSLKAALALAAGHSCSGVTIFDTLAKWDCAQEWDSNGNILSFKHRNQHER